MLSGKEKKSIKSEIKETKQIRDILNYCSFDSFVILDLDNTVMESTEELGSDAWFVKLIDYACRIIPNTTEAIHLVITIYHAVQHHVEQQVVEPIIIPIIKALQDIHIPVIALTARGTPIIKPTLLQLNKMGIDFSRQWGVNSFPLDSMNKQENQPIFYDGIIFCNGVDKGKCLKLFFENLEHHPSSIVMVDDKEKHLLSVQNTIKKPGTRFVGLRYSYLDDKAAAVDMKKATEQLQKIYSFFPDNVKDTSIKLKLAPPATEKTHTI